MKLSKQRLTQAVRVKDLLAKNVGGAEDARSVHHLHASDLTKQDPAFCPREVALMRLLGVKRPAQYVQHAMRVTWDEGRDKQWRVNNDYLRSHMVGDWRCLRCDQTAEWSTYPSTEGCALGGHRWEYEEPVFHHPSKFTGSIDGVVRFSPARQRMLEVKIIKGDDFKTLKAPLAEHRVRTQLYLRLIAESPDARTSQIDVSAGHVLYIMRGHGMKDEVGQISPFREFVVERNDAAVERYIRMAYAASGDMPEGICASAMGVRASKCPVAKECFSGKYPAKTKWSDSV
jgi:hypothetical protein